MALRSSFLILVISGSEFTLSESSFNLKMNSPSIEKAHQYFPTMNFIFFGGRTFLKHSN
jgi:hypothetical protein